MKYTMKQTMRGFLSVKVALNAKLTLHPGEWKLLAGSVYTVHVHYRTFFDRYRPSAMTFESAAPFFTIFNSGTTLENGLHSNSQLEGYAMHTFGWGRAIGKTSHFIICFQVLTDARTPRESVKQGTYFSIVVSTHARVVD